MIVSTLSLSLVALVLCTSSLAMTQPLNCSKLERLERHNQLMSDAEPAKGDKFVDFDWKISKELNAVEKGNIVISPISLKVVLAMLFEGARGKTANEIGEALDLSNTTMARRMNSRQRFSTILKSLQTSDGDVEIKIGTHVFIDKTAVLKELYQCKLQHYYNSDMERVDFSNTTAAVSVINNWASNVTEGHIQHLISEAEDHSSTIMLLLNAVYFKGLWQIPFPENQTYSGAFHLNDKQSVNVSLMNTTGKYGYNNITDLNAQLIRLPYQGGKFAMYVLLPNSKTGLNTLAEALGPDRPLTTYLRTMTLTTVNLIMPKFEFDFTTSLRPTLEKLNIKTMFSPEADLSDVAEAKSGSLVVSNVLQKAGISVTEIGTVAYAATVAELMDKFGGDEELVEFRADRPFLFFIEDESVHTTVFVGKVTNPEKVAINKDTSTPQTGTSTPPSGVATPGGTSTAKPSHSDGTMGSSSNGTDNRIGDDQMFNQARFNFFDADLLKELGNKESGNFVVSPASIKALLALVIEGAEGSTLAELQGRLRLPENITESRMTLSALQNILQKSASSKVIVDSVAQAFVNNMLSPNMTYAKVIKDHYKADIRTIDFSSPNVAANNINSWINTRTRGLIPTLIDPDMITTDTFAILTSAVYFNGKWKEEFLMKDTTEMCFYAEPNLECQLIPMMAKTEELYYKHDPEFDAHVLQIPYEDERYSMVIVLPRKKNGMKFLTDDVSRLTFPKLLDKMVLHEVNLKLPRFTIEYGTELINTLNKMGLREIFSDKAQLPYMINGKLARVSAMVHKAKIEVTEKGTKAAAASGAAVIPLMYGLDVVDFDVNHPFYYYIYERDSQTVLFEGRLSSLSGVSESPLPPKLEVLSKPSTHAAQNHQYVPSVSPTRRYTNEPIHFPDPSTKSNYDKNFIKYMQQHNRNAS